MISFKQYLVEASYSSGRTLKTISVKGTYKTTEDTELQRGAWKAIRMFQTGRDWQAEQILVLLKPEPIVVEVIKELDSKYVRVKIVSGENQPIVQFAKRPYTSKKTGIQNPNVLLGNQHGSLATPLKDEYGVWGGEMTVRKEDLV